MTLYTVAELIAKDRFGPKPEAERIAVIAGEETRTYADVEDRAERLAAGLASVGFRHGDRMCVLMHNRLEWHEIFFALARLGGVLVPVNHLLATPEIRYIVEDSGARWFAVQDALWDAVAPLVDAVEAEFITVGGERSGARPYEDVFASERLASRPDVSGDDVLLLQYTSGTTGFPKGAIHTHSTVMWNAISQREHFSVTDASIYLCLPALSWVAGFHSLHFQTLWSGGTVVLGPTDVPFDPERFCELVERHRVTSVAWVPTVMRRILGAEGLTSRDLSSLEIAIVGGEAVPVHLLTDMHERLPQLSLIQVYGMSEFPSLVTLLEPSNAAAKLGSAGKPNCVSQLRVVDGEDCDLPPGEIGEIVTRSPALMLGYHGLPEESGQALRGGWFHTGDLGYLDEEGYLFMRGRSKDVIISGGLNIYPAEVEAALSRHDSVAEVAVIAEPDEKWGEIAKAVVVLSSDTEESGDDFRRFLEPQVARFKIPKRWEIRTGPPLPRTASGKLQKFKLAAQPGSPRRRRHLGPDEEGG